ncbi:MAG: VIT domain-containing protein [bacterium]|nr:VIT domain-containing protein [bacterium]
MHSSLRRIAAGMLLIAVAMFGIPAPRVFAAEDATAISSPDLPGGTLHILVKEGEQPKEFPLKHTDVVADIAGHLSHVTVTQEFVNPYEEPIEAIYVFPLPEDAAVNRMEMHIGDRVVKAVIKTREEARATYEQARREGRRTSLLEQERPNIFTQSVANIRPGESITIEIGYVHALVPDNGTYTFVFPMVVGPRYIPGETVGQPSSAEASQGEQGTGWAPDTTQVPDASRITPPVLKPGERSGHDIDVAVRLDAGFPITDLRSIAHEVITETPGEGRAVVRIKETDRIPNKDFVLRWKTPSSRIAPAFLTHRGTDGAGTFLLLMQPPEFPAANAITAKELIFIVDTSGSMSGEPISKVKAAMRYALQHLNPNDTFTILSFQSETNWLSETLLTADATNIERGLRYINDLTAGGGTEMLKATQAALRFPKNDSARVRIISLMSDGYVGNERNILTQVQTDLGNTQLFPFGVGSSVNRYLITALAQVGRGSATFVTLRESGEQAVEAFYNRIASPLLTDIRIDWGGLTVSDVVPAQIPDLFAGQLVTMVGKYAQPGSGTIRITGNAVGRPTNFELPVTLPPQESSHAALPTIWARWRVTEIENNYRMEPAAQQQEITALGLAYSIATAYTSFVAVEELPPETPGKPPRQVSVPVELPEGVSYEGVFGDGKGGGGIGGCTECGGGGFESSAPASMGPLGIGRGVTAGIEYGGPTSLSKRESSPFTRFLENIMGSSPNTAQPKDSVKIPKETPPSLPQPLWRRYLPVILVAVVVLGGALAGIVAVRNRKQPPGTPPAPPPPAAPPQPPTT